MDNIYYTWVPYSNQIVESRRKKSHQRKSIKIKNSIGNRVQNIRCIARIDTYQVDKLLSLNSFHTLWGLNLVFVYLSNRANWNFPVYYHKTWVVMLVQTDFSTTSYRFLQRYKSIWLGINTKKVRIKFNSCSQLQYF